MLFFRKDKPTVVNLPGPQTMGANIAPTIVSPKPPPLSIRTGGTLFMIGGLLVLLVGLGIGTFLVTRPKSQNPQSKAAGTCAPIGWLENPGPANGATNVSTTPDFSWTFERSEWGQIGDWINIYVWRCPEMVDSCKSIFHTKFETSGPVYSIPWSEAGKVDPLDCNQTYWWQAYVSDACIGPMVPNATWHFTTGCPSQQVGCNQTCNGTTILCSSPDTCTGGKCVNPSCPTTQDSSCVCPSAPVAACQNVVADKDLTKIAIGDTVTFTGRGTVSDSTDQIDLIKFTILNGTTSVFTGDIAAVVDTGNTYKATKSITITDPGSYSVQIQVHQKKADKWFQ